MNTRNSRDSRSVEKIHLEKSHHMIVTVSEMLVGCLPMNGTVDALFVLRL